MDFIPRTPADAARRRRYQMDPVFHRLVDGIRAAMAGDIVTATDVQDALDLAEDLEQEDALARRIERTGR